MVQCSACVWVVRGTCVCLGCVVSACAKGMGVGHGVVDGRVGSYGGGNSVWWKSRAFVMWVLFDAGYWAFSRYGACFSILSCLFRVVTVHGGWFRSGSHSVFQCDNKRFGTAVVPG